MQCALSCRRATEVGLICGFHRDRLAAMLDPEQHGQVFAKPGEARVVPSIPVLYGQLSTQRTAREPGPIGPPAFGPSSPADDTAIVLRDERSRSRLAGPDDVERAPNAPVAVLLELAIRVINGRGAPERRPAVTVQALSGWLHGYVDWIADQPWVGEAWEELRALSHTLRAAVGDPAPGSLGGCWVLVDDDGQPDPDGAWRCARPLYMPELPPRASDEPIQLPALRCAGCGYHYTAAELWRLARDCERAAS